MSIRNEQIKSALVLGFDVLYYPPDGVLTVCDADHVVRSDCTYHVYLPSGMKIYRPEPEQLEFKFDKGA
jgi:hypothetical protein